LGSEGKWKAESGERGGIDMRIDSRGRVTIPKVLREQFGLYPGAAVEFTSLPDRIEIRKKQIAIDEVVGTVKLRFGKNVDDYIEQVRGR
jgi:AbrB family looped-hinge helix DNA binding protein